MIAAVIALLILSATVVVCTVAVSCRLTDLLHVLQQIRGNTLASRGEVARLRVALTTPPTEDAWGFCEECHNAVHRDDAQCAECGWVKPGAVLTKQGPRLVGLN